MSDPSDSESETSEPECCKLDSWVSDMQACADRGMIAAPEMALIRQHVELSVDYLVRTERLRTMMVALQAREEETRGHSSVPFDTITRHFGIFLTSQTRQNVYIGVKSSLDNFVRLLSDTCEVAEDANHMAPPRDSHSIRLAGLRERAGSFLWESIDTPDLSSGSIRKRALAAVNRLWITDAKSAIDEERALLCNACTHIEALSRFCGNLIVKPFGNLRFLSMLDAHRLELEGARKAIANSRHFRAKFRRLEPLENMTNNEAGEWFRAHADACHSICGAILKEVSELMERDDEHVCWHMIQIYEETGDGPSLQAPATHAPFRTRLLLGSPEQECTHPYALPVVRLCAALRQLILKDHFKIDMIGLNYLKRVTSAEYAKFETTIERIVTEILKPAGQRCGLPFDSAWYASLPRVKEAGAAAEAGLRSLNEAVAEDAREDVEDGADSASDVAPQEVADEMRNVHQAVSSSYVAGAATRSVAEALSSVAPDMGLDFVVLEAIDRALSGSNPYATSYTFQTNDLVSRVRRLCPPGSLPASTTGVQQRIAGAFKLLSNAMHVVGVEASYNYVRGPHVKVLKISNVPEQNNLAKARAILGSLLRHLEMREPLPDGVTWHRPRRTSRRHANGA